jgi:hypothetical protein
MLLLFTLHNYFQPQYLCIQSIWLKSMAMFQNVLFVGQSWYSGFPDCERGALLPPLETHLQPFVLCYFGDGVLLFTQEGLDRDLPILSFPSSWNDRCASPHSAFNH